MTHRTITVGLIAALSSILWPGSATAGGQPIIERWVDQYVLEPDPLFIDVCGIETTTDVIERYTVIEFPDGSLHIHAVRTYRPADRRLPVELSAATALIRADGTRSIVGAPIQLRWRDGHRVVLDAGIVTFGPHGELVAARGPHPSLSADLDDLYCPDPAT